MKPRILSLFLAMLALGADEAVIIPAITSATTSTVSGTMRNIYQTNHELWVTYANSGGTCAPPAAAAYVQVEASYDGTTYFGVTPAPLNLTTISGGYQARVAATGGPYRIIRVNLYSAPSANCAVTAWYTGTKTPTNYPQLLPSAIGQYRQVSNIGLGASSDLLIAPQSIDAAKRFAVYGMVISNTDTSAALKVTLTERAAGCSGALLQTYGVYTLPAAGPPMVLASGGVPWFLGSAAGSSLCGTFAGTAPNWSISATYRLEN